MRKRRGWYLARMAHLRIKVCCIASREEAELAIGLGADAVGLVGAMPSGPGPIPRELIRTIAGGVPPPIATWMLTSETTTERIVEQVREAGVGVVQIVDDDVTDRTRLGVRESLPHIRVVQVIHVVGEASVRRALDAAGTSHALLLDSGRPELAVRELGGTGRTHDWAVSAEIVRRCPVPVFLAGGLRADNVAEAVRRVRPFGVDVCSGVRTDGALDEHKARGLITAARRVELEPAQ